MCPRIRWVIQNLTAALSWFSFIRQIQLQYNKRGKTPSFQMVPSSSFMKHPPSLEAVQTEIQSDTKKRELLKNPTKIEEIKKKLLTEIEPLQLAFKRQ